MFPPQSIFQYFILGSSFITWYNVLQLIINPPKIPQEGYKEDINCGRTVKEKDEGVSLLPFFPLA